MAKRKTLARESIDHFDARARHALKKEMDGIKRVLKDLHARRRAAIAQARSHCKASRTRATARARAVRAEQKRLADLEIAKLRDAGTRACAARVTAARGRSVAEEQRLKSELRDRRNYERVIAGDKSRKRPKATTAAERKRESDDEVRFNLSPELVPFFDSVRHLIKGKPGKVTRTEQFLEYVEENPEEAADFAISQGERQSAEEIREHELDLQRIERALSKRRLRANDWATLGVDPNELRELGLVPEDPSDVLEFMNAIARGHSLDASNVPF